MTVPQSITNSLSFYDTLLTSSKYLTGDDSEW